MSDANRIVAPTTRRSDRIARQCIERFDLDLRGLTVLTEAATGNYRYSPIIAALAGARKVFAVAADSSYGSREDVESITMDAAERLGVESVIEVVFDKTEQVVSASDIVTNSGFVRPIHREMITSMKPTAVIPLMFEAWELREADVDLEACQDHGVLVMGTDESQPPLAYYRHNFFLACRLLFDLGLDGHKTRTLLLGGGGGFDHIYHDFKKLGMEIRWFGDSGTACSRYDLLPDHFAEHGHAYDVIILAEIANSLLLLGAGGLLPYERIVDANPSMAIGIIAGNVDVDGLQRSGLLHHPELVRPFGYMSYQAYPGPLPVLELYAAGLKVAEAMARGRLRGLSVEQTKQYAMERSAAQVCDTSRPAEASQ